MEMSTENAKISDSGYSNTGSNSQSYTSSDTFHTPIIKRKDKGPKQKKFKKFSSKVSTTPVSLLNPSSWSSSTESNNYVFNQTTGLVDVTKPEIHNENLTNSSEVGVVSKSGPIDNFSSHSNEEHYAVISMLDGLVLHVSPSIYVSLGYPTDWWTGKLFIDFLDPKDKHLILDRIASEIAISKDFHPSGTSGSKASIFCRIRRFNLCSPSENQYVPYRINLVVQNLHEDKRRVSQNPFRVLVASFQSLCSAYKVPEEIIIPKVFTTRHTATCTLSYVDPEIVQYLGYLPQDMINRSLFDFYHPEDLPLIKQIYKTVINLRSKSYKSEPYRFIIRNGSFVVLETEWSCFIHPWTKSVEFVVGQHRVQKGPADPNIFRPPSNQNDNLLLNNNRNALQKAKVIQKEIVSLLVEDVQKRSPYTSTNMELTTEDNELSSFAQFLLQEIKISSSIKDQVATDFSDHESVMLGKISPHHAYLDSKSSTETLPSYNQLNYQDNIERFFNSNISASVKSDISNKKNDHSSGNSIDELGKDDFFHPELKCSSGINESGNNGSIESLSSESINQQNLYSQDESSIFNNNHKLMILTESLLNKHNEHMEKLLMIKHRDQKKDDKRNRSNDQELKIKQLTMKYELSNKNKNRLKRSRNINQDINKNLKNSKYENSMKMSQNLEKTLESWNMNPVVMFENTPLNIIQTNSNVGGWPSNSVLMMPTMMNTQHCLVANTCFQSISQASTASQMSPVYYLPAKQSQDNPFLSNIPQTYPDLTKPTNQPLPYLPYVMLNGLHSPIVGTSPPNAIMYSSFPIVIPDIQIPSTLANNAASITGSLMRIHTPSEFERTTNHDISKLRNNVADSSKKICFTSRTVSSYAQNEESFSSTDNITLTDTEDNSTIDDNVTDFSVFSDSLIKSSDTNSNTDQCHTVLSVEQHQKSKKGHVNCINKSFNMRRKEPPWNKDIELTSELIYQYKINPKPLDEVLKEDLKFLNQSKQPSLVNDQLEQLYLNMDLGNLSSNVLLEDPDVNSNSNESTDGLKSLDSLDSCLGLFADIPWSLQEKYKNVCDFPS